MGWGSFYFQVNQKKSLNKPLIRISFILLVQYTGFRVSWMNPRWDSSVYEERARLNCHAFAIVTYRDSRLQQDQKITDVAQFFIGRSSRFPGKGSQIYFAVKQKERTHYRPVKLLWMWKDDDVLSACMHVRTSNNTYNTVITGRIWNEWSSWYVIDRPSSSITNSKSMIW